MQVGLSVRGLGAGLTALAVLTAVAPRALAVPPTASSQAPPPTAEDDDGTGARATTVEGVDVVVRKDYAHQVGAVVGDITPDIQLGPADIRSYGVSTVTDLLSELSPEIRSDRGRGGEAPVVLLNGRRISGLGEIQNIPTEAIMRVDILPEEVALKYGYSADQRVVNIVLRRRFRATTAEASGGGATEGGEAAGAAELDQLRIRRDDRLNLDLKYKGSTDITEADRGVAPTMATPGETGADRTLSPSDQTLTANAVLAHPLPGGVNATVDATVGGDTSDALRGLPPMGPADGPLHQYVDSWSAHLGSTLNRDLKSWRLSLTDGYDHADSQTDTDAGPGRAQAYSRSISDAANVQVLANGPLVKLPAGDIYVSAKGGDTQSWQAGASTRFGQSQSVSLSRNDANGQLNIDVPLTSRRNRVLAFLGDLSVNANGSVDQLSDYGTLKTFGYGVNWTPFPGYTLLVSHTNDQAAPSIQQLGGATLYTPGVPVFDYATGQTVNVTQVSGGNPHLIADNRNVLKIGLTLKPIATQDLTISANYIKSDIDNPILTFPATSGPLEAAFPARFVRDASGALIEEDVRPVNFGRSERSEIRWGLNYSRPIGKQPTRDQLRAAFRAFAQSRRPPGAPPPTPEQAGDPDRARGTGGGPGGPGGPGRFGGFPTGGRLQVAVYHTLYLVDRERVGPVGPTLDLLNGAPATGTGGQYRNEIEGQLGVTLKGYGARLSADWREGTHVAGVPGSPTGNLAFSSLTTLNLRLFDNFTQQAAVIRRFPWLRGARLSFNIINLLDQRIQVRDGLGLTPLGYQGPYLDPAGRTITISLRKLFF